MDSNYQPPLSGPAPNAAFKPEPREAWGHWLLDLLLPLRLGRLNFFLRAVPANVILAVLYDDYGTSHHKFSLIAIIGAVLLLFYFVGFIMLPRIKSCGLPAWCLILGFIPVVASLFGFALLFKSEYVFKSSTATDPAHAKTLEPTSVAGAKCARCGNKLLLESDGSVTGAGDIVCNECQSPIETA